MSATSTTTRKQYTRVATSQPRYVKPGQYMVDSDTQTLVSYRVRLDEHGWECSCPQYARHYECKHVNAVLFVESVVSDAPRPAELEAPDFMRSSHNPTEVWGELAELLATDPRESTRPLRLEDLYE